MPLRVSTAVSVRWHCIRLLHRPETVCPRRPGCFRQPLRSDRAQRTGPAPSPAQVETIASYPLGAARAQVHANYIVAQTSDGLVIVDQHAAHERLVFEQMRKALTGRRLPSQGLLIPEIVDLPEEDCDRLMTHAEGLEQLGLAIERFGPGAIAVRETPAMLGEMDTAGLVRDLATRSRNGTRPTG